jgi:hypothetical protein
MAADETRHVGDMVPAAFIQDEIDYLQRQARGQAESYQVGGNGLAALGGIGLIVECMSTLPKGESVAAALLAVPTLGAIAAGVALRRRGDAISRPLVARQDHLRAVLQAYPQ